MSATSPPAARAVSDPPHLPPTPLSSAAAAAPADRPGLGQFTLFPARAFLAFGWTRAGVEKVIEREWWTGAKLEEFLVVQREAMLPFMGPLVDSLVAPAPMVTGALVILVELGLGAALLTGRRLGTSLLVASALNIIFVLMGVVTPSAFYLVIQLTLLLAAGVSSGWLGRRRRVGLAVGCGVSGLALAPFITTLHPAEVIHDPAIMLATLALLTGAAQVFTLVGLGPRGAGRSGARSAAYRANRRLSSPG